jgi:Taurine catabolism dioxygenase TauD, TfdA family
MRYVVFGPYNSRTGAHSCLSRTVFSYGAERFEDGASQINKSDMFFGDDGELTEAQLKHLDEVTMKNVRFVKMTEGDVVLLDNYKTMHGRNVFDGTRKHGVAWFEGWEGEEEMKEGTTKASQTVPFFVNA